MKDPFLCGVCGEVFPTAYYFTTIKPPMQIFFCALFLVFQEFPLTDGREDMTARNSSASAMVLKEEKLRRTLPSGFPV